MKKYYEVTFMIKKNSYKDWIINVEVNIAKEAKKMSKIYGIN